MRHSLMRTAAVAALALAATAAVGSTAASASPGTSPVHHAQIRYGGVHAYNQNGGNWSGYAAQGSGFTSVVSTWTEPTVTCNSRNDLFAPWVGIDGYGTSTVEQTGVETDCSSGRPVYSAWYEMYPAGPVYYTNTVGAGDSITAKVTRSGSTYTLVLTDNTRGWSKTTTKSSTRARNASAEVIIESPTAAYPNFHSVSFTGSTVNGSALSGFGPVALDASNSGGYEDRTGALSGGNFAITYLRE